MQSANDSNRIMELVEKIKLEQDQGRFTALVEEPNQLLDGDPLIKKPPAEECLDFLPAKWLIRHETTD